MSSTEYILVSVVRVISDLLRNERGGLNTLPKAPFVLACLPSIFFLHLPWIDVRVEDTELVQYFFSNRKGGALLPALSKMLSWT